jgi:tetratricopeptide (TPR) repeat protein
MFHEGNLRIEHENTKGVLPSRCVGTGPVLCRAALRSVVPDYLQTPALYLSRLPASHTFERPHTVRPDAKAYCNEFTGCCRRDFESHLSPDTYVNRYPIFIIHGILLLFLCSGPKVDPGATARIYGARALQLFAEGNLNGAVKEYQKAYVLAARADLPHLQAQYLFNIGRVWYELDKIDSAHAAFQNAYREFMYYQDMENASTASGFIALSFCKRGMYDSAFVWYQNGRPEELKGNSQTAFWLTVQSLLSLLKNRTPEASAWFDRAYECYEKEKSWNGMAQIDFYRARIAYSQAHFEDARQLLYASLALLDKTPDRFKRWRILLATARTSQCLGDGESAKRFYRRALDCAPKGIVIPSIDLIMTCTGSIPE